MLTKEQIQLYKKLIPVYQTYKAGYMIQHYVTVRVVQGEAGEVISLHFLTCTVKGTLLFCNLLWVRVMVFNTTFNNISVILWRSVLLVEEKTTGVTKVCTVLQGKHQYTCTQQNLS
jgi:hypothetical protein